MEGGQPCNKRLGYTRHSDQSFSCRDPKNRRSIYEGAANQDHAGVTAFAHIRRQIESFFGQETGAEWLQRAITRPRKRMVWPRGDLED